MRKYRQKQKNHKIKYGRKKVCGVYKFAAKLKGRQTDGQ